MWVRRESVAGGVVFTIPALIFLIPFGPSLAHYVQITLLTLAGGILGVLMMVPLRRALIVKEHGVLPIRKARHVPSARRRRARWPAGGARVQRSWPGVLWKALSWIFNLFRAKSAT